MSLTSLINYESDSENDGEHPQQALHIDDDEMLVDRYNCGAGYNSSQTIEASNSITGRAAAGTVSLLDRLPPFHTCNEDTAASVISNIHKFLNSGLDVTMELRKIKQFSNPYILTKVVTQLGIDEIGSNYPMLVFDPHGYGENDFEDQIKRRYAAYVAPAVPSSAIHSGQFSTTGVPTSKQLTGVLIEKNIGVSVVSADGGATKKRTRWSSDTS